MTLGDTVSVPIVIGNLGDAPLTVSSIDLPPGIGLSASPPYLLAPNSTLEVRVEIAALDTIRERRELIVRSDDPLSPADTVSWENRVRAIQVETLALSTAASYPLGEPIVVESVPLDGVRVERVTLYYRSGRGLNFEGIPMTRNVRAFIGIIPGTSVQEGDLDFYVKAENSGFEAFDPIDGDRRPYRLNIGSPDEFQFNAVVRNPGLTWRVGESVDFLLTLPRGTVFENGTLWYRRGGDTTWDSVEIIEMSFTGIAASIPGTSVGPTGVEYWAEIYTLTTRLTIPRENPESGPLEIRVSVENLIEPNTHPAGRYRLFSVPCEPPGATTLGTILSDHSEFGAYDVLRWRAFRYLPALGANVELPGTDPDQFELVPGRAFWLISRAVHRVDTAPATGLSTRLADPWPIVLEPGWNAIGNPFAFAVPWSWVRRPAEVGDPVAFDPALGDYSEVVPEVLEPFEGYFVENPADTAVTIRVAAEPPGIRARPPASESARSEFGWRLEARAGGGVDRANSIGVASDAAAERDPLDAGKPPAPPGARVRLAIANRGWRDGPGLYRRDVRPPDPGHTWDLELTSAAGGEPIDLVLRPEGAVPAGTELRLLDREQDSVVELRPAADGSYRHTVLSFGPVRAYRVAVLAGGEGYLRRSTADAALPERLTLDPVSPNPARGALRVRFGLPRAASARLEVFDVTGQRVASLLDGATTPAGFHSVVWTGSRDGGERAPSGMYYLRLTVGAETRVARAVVVR